MANKLVGLVTDSKTVKRNLVFGFVTELEIAPYAESNPQSGFEKSKDKRVSLEIKGIHRLDVDEQIELEYIKETNETNQVLKYTIMRNGKAVYKFDTLSKERVPSPKLV